MNKSLLLLVPACLLFFSCNSNETNELRKQNSMLSEVNTNLKLQVKELDTENKDLNERIKRQDSQVSENNNVKTNKYSGAWFTEGLNVNDEKQKVYRSHIIIKDNTDNSCEIIGYSGINSFVVSMTADDSSINIHDDFICTNIPGDAEIMDFENTFFKCLKGASKIQLLRSGDGKYLCITNLEENCSLWFRYGVPSSFLPDVPNP